MVARPARQPGLNLGMLVGAVVVRDQMEVDSRGDAAVEVVKKREQFLLAMARLTQGNHFTIEGVECREQGGSAVAVVIVSYSFDIAQSHRQDRLGTFQRLDLALLIHTQHQRLVGRIKVAPYDVATCSTKNGSVESLKLLLRCGCKPNSVK